jgi:hypothetical protein
MMITAARAQLPPPCTQSTTCVHLPQPTPPARHPSTPAGKFNLCASGAPPGARRHTPAMERPTREREASVRTGASREIAGAGGGRGVSDAQRTPEGAKRQKEAVAQHNGARKLVLGEARVERATDRGAGAGAAGGKRARGAPPCRRPAWGQQPGHGRFRVPGAASVAKMVSVGEVGCEPCVPRARASGHAWAMTRSAAVPLAVGDQGIVRCKSNQIKPPCVQVGRAGPAQALHGHQRDDRCQQQPGYGHRVHAPGPV